MFAEFLGQISRTDASGLLTVLYLGGKRATASELLYVQVVFSRSAFSQNCARFAVRTVPLRFSIKLLGLFKLLYSTAYRCQEIPRSVMVLASYSSGTDLPI